MFVLVTGFEPFGGDSTNASWEAVSRLPGTVGGPGGDETELLTVQLPVSFDRAGSRIEGLMDRYRPDAVVCVGVAGSRSVVTVEAAATNTQWARMSDNDGDQPRHTPVVAGGPAVLPATLPVERLVRAAVDQGVPSEESRDAGQFVCNATYYRALTAADARSREPGARIPAVVFVHVPPPSRIATPAVRDALAGILGEVVHVLQERPTDADRSVLVHGGARATRLRVLELPRARAPRLGISGGVGAGKSTVSRVFRRHGAVVADADQLAHAVVEPGSRGLAQVVEEFGSHVLASDGSLDREALARVVFADERARERLEGVLHPLIARRARAIMQAAPANTLAVYDVPLLVETGMEDLFDVVLMVDAPLEERLRRLERRGLSREQTGRRIAAQAGAAQRRAAATVWIDNAGSAGDLEEVVDLVIDQWIVRPPE